MCQRATCRLSRDHAIDGVLMVLGMVGEIGHFSGIHSTPFLLGPRHEQLLDHAPLNTFQPKSVALFTARADLLTCSPDSSPRWMKDGGHIIGAPQAASSILALRDAKNTGARSSTAPSRKSLN